MLLIESSTDAEAQQDKNILRFLGFVLKTAILGLAAIGLVMVVGFMNHPKFPYMMVHLTSSAYYAVFGVSL